MKSLLLTDRDLLYAATARCRCGAGLAYPLDHELSMAVSAWMCSAVLKGDGSIKATSQALAAFGGGPRPGEHDSLDWAFFKVREETSVNNAGGHTTRPAGTIARTVGKATCPTCKHEWESEPYDASTKGWPEEYNGKPHVRHGHWMSGPCPNCGHAVGGGTSYSTTDGPAIDKRYRDVVLEQMVTP